MYRTKITIEAWTAMAKAVGEKEAERLLGKKPELTFSEQVEHFDGIKQLEIMRALVDVYVDFKNPLREKLTYAMNLARKYWKIKGKQTTPIEGQVFHREWAIRPEPTDFELQANWVSASNTTKCTYYRIYRELSKFMPQTDSLTPVKPLD